MIIQVEENRNVYNQITECKNCGNNGEQYEIVIEGEWADYVPSPPQLVVEYFCYQCQEQTTETIDLTAYNSQTLVIY